MPGLGALRGPRERRDRSKRPRTSHRAPAPSRGAAVPGAPPPSAPPAITSPRARLVSSYKKPSRWAATSLRSPKCAGSRRAHSFEGQRLHRSAAGTMREIVHIQAGQCGNQIGAKVGAPGEGSGRGRRAPKVWAGSGVGAAGPRVWARTGGKRRRRPACLAGAFSARQPGGAQKPTQPPTISAATQLNVPLIRSFESS